MHARDREGHHHVTPSPRSADRITLVVAAEQASSVGDETVDQTGATTSFQLILTATARAMRGVPGIHVPGVLESGTVMVPHDRRTLSALRPVPASGVATGRRVESLRVGAGQNVVRVDRVAAAANHLAFFGQGRLLVNIVRI
jgi:hypothetical protein